MSIRDRDYQTEAVNSIWNYYRSGKTGNPLIAMPTGTGKSIVIARFLQSVFQYFPRQRVMILTHVKELIQQNYEKLMAVWPFAPAGVYSSGLNQRTHNRAITFAGIASVAKKPALFGHIDLVLIDEAHLVSPTEATMYRTFIAALLAMNPHLKVIGLTATPWRLGQGHLTEDVVVEGKEPIPALFTDVCFDITGVAPFNRLIAEGYLLPLVPRKTKTQLDTSAVHMRGGEFIESELQNAVDKDETTKAAIDEALQLAHDRRKWLVFASGVDHAEHITDMLNFMGVPAGCVHSKRDDRDKTIADFKAGRLRAVVNNNVLTTGFDDPEIDLIIVLRPTASPVLWVQMLGRGTRPLFVNPLIGHNKGPTFDLDTIDGRLRCIAASPKQDCLVLDYAGNTQRLGPINDPVIPKKKGEKTGDAPMKACPMCGTYYHVSVRVCTALNLETRQPCGHEFKFENKLEDKASDQVLIVGDVPKIEIFAVDHVTITKHTKADRPPMVKLTYYCGSKSFNEFVCVEHKDFAFRKATQWWRERGKGPMPKTTDELMLIIKSLPVATHLRVWMKKPYPEVMATDLTGTAFGKTERADYDEGPTVEVSGAPGNVSGFVESLKGATQSKTYDDDEIPF